LFSSYGEVFSVEIDVDSSNGKSHGIGHIHMPIEAQAKNAIIGLHGMEIHGRKIMVSEEGNSQKFQSFT
jgi:RNA recognition motif-containing protein